MPTDHDARFGELAVTLGLVAPADVIAVLRILRERKSDRPLAEMLVEQGRLTREEVDRVEAAMQARPGSGDSAGLPGQGRIQAPTALAATADEGSPPGLAPGGGRIQAPTSWDTRVGRAGSDADEDPGAARRGRVEPPSEVDLGGGRRNRRIEPPSDMDLGRPGAPGRPPGTPKGAAPLTLPRSSGAESGSSVPPGGPLTLPADPPVARGATAARVPPTAAAVPPTLVSDPSDDPSAVPVTNRSAGSGAPDAGEAGGTDGASRYEILGEIGRGGMGVVYRARQKGLNRIVALKVLGGGATASREEVERFRREAQAAARLHHPGIIEVHDVGEIDGRPYIAMEYVEGDALDTHVGRTRADLAARVQLVRRVAEAVAHAHGLGVVHRDLKPANVLVDPAGNPRVADFGLAKEVNTADGTAPGPAAPITRSGAVLGTPQYMAPEQAEGDVRAVDARSDVWSLGVILYEMLTGRRPFEGDSAIAILLAVLGREVLPPRRIDPAIPADLETVCLKALEKERARRYPTAQALADDLGRFLAGEPITARPPSWSRLWVRRARRHSTLVLALAAIPALAVIAGIAWRSWEGAEEARREQERLAAVARVEQEARKRAEDEARAREDRRTRARKLYDRAKLQQNQEKIADGLGEAIAADPEWADPRLERGILRARARRWQEAVEDLTRAIELNPGLAYAYYHRADAYRDGLKELDRAQQDYLKVVELDPESEHGFFAQGMLRWLKEDSQGAIPWFERGLEIDAESGWMWHNLAGCRMVNGDYRKASEDWERAVALLPGEGEPRNKLGWTYERMEHWKKAEECFRKAIALAPELEEAHCGLGSVLIKLGQGDEALRELEEAIRLRADYVDPHLRKVELFRLARRPDLAHAEAQKTLERYPGHAGAHDALGTTFYDMNRFAEAIAAHERALEKDPENSYFLLHRANALLGLGRMAEAEKDLSKALSIRPLWADALNSRAAIRYHANDLEGALADFRVIADMMSDRPEGYTNCGEILRALGRFDEALKEFAKALAIDPDYGVALNSRGATWQQLGDQEKAFADFDRCVKEHPYYSNALFNRARIYELRGELEKAIADWEAAIVADPNHPGTAETRARIEDAKKRLKK